MISINERLKTLRDSLDYSQEEFGKILGITRSGVSNIESGLRKVNEKHIKFLVNALNVNEQWLRTGKGEMLMSLGRDEEITIWASRITCDDYRNEFVKRFAVALTKLDENDWLVIEKLMKMTLEETKKD